MTREDLNKKRDELMELFSEKTKVADQGLAFYDKRFGFEQGFNACADILLPEIDRLNFNHKHLHDAWSICINRIKELEKMAPIGLIDLNEKIKELEKENFDFKTALGVSGEFISRNMNLEKENADLTNLLDENQGRIEYFKTIYSKLTAQLAIATEALEVSALGQTQFDGVEAMHSARQALEKMKDVK